MCLFLSEESGKIIRKIASEEDLQTVHKGDNSPVTKADLLVQKTLESTLRELYPSLDIQGEESMESLADIQPATTG